MDEWGGPGVPGKAVGGQRTSTFCPYLCRTSLGAEGCGDRSAEELDQMQNWRLGRVKPGGPWVTSSGFLDQMGGTSRRNPPLGGVRWDKLFALRGREKRGSIPAQCISVPLFVDESCGLSGLCSFFMCWLCPKGLAHHIRTSWLNLMPLQPVTQHLGQHFQVWFRCVINTCWCLADMFNHSFNLCS